MKKLTSVLLAIMLVLSVCSVAMAANSITEKNDTVGSAGNTVTWTDTFTKANGDTSTQNLPAADFIYTIEAGTGAAATSTTPLIKAGEGSPTISKAEHGATASGETTDSVDVTADFSTVDFTEAGIYRYNVTETRVDSVSSDDIELDIAQQGESKGKYILDVYVKKNDDGSFSPYAYVLSKEGTITKFEHGKEGGEDVLIVDYTGKVSEITNELTTYDLTIEKEIQGDVAANSFDFTIVITDVPDEVFIKWDSSAAESGNKTIEITLGDGDSTTIYGLPSYAKYAISEKVNRLEGYKVTVTETQEDQEVDKGDYGWVPDEVNATVYGMDSQNAVAMGEGDVNVKFVNELLNISPTGVVLRVAPYALILIAGIALLMISRRRRTEKE